MKRIHLFLTVCLILITTAGIFAQPIVNIPDANFKNALVIDPAINLNMDTEIDSLEAASFTGAMSIGYLNISDLSGIEAFINLTALSANGNNLTSVMLDSNSAITSLNLSYNQLTSIDVSSLLSLSSFYASNNQLTTVDMSMIPWIYTVDLSYNSLASLDITNNPGINYLYLDSNNLSALNTDNNYQLLTLFCRDNNIASLNLKQNTWLQTLYCGTNPFSCLDAGDNISLSIFACSNAPNLAKLNLKNGNNGSLTPIVSGCPMLSCVQVDDSSFSVSNWSNFGGSSYFSNDCGIPTATFTHNAPVCNGTPVVFDQTTTNIDWFKWDFGDGDTSTVSIDPSHLYTYGGNYYVTLTAGSCYGHAQPWSDVILGNPIAGYIDYSGGAFGNGNVVLLQYDPIYTSYDTVAVYWGFEVAGYYSFDNVYDGQYIIKVFPDTSVLPNLISTYSGNQPNWETATVINHNCFAPDTMDITILEITPGIPGPGSISGEIYEGPGFGRAQGDPVHGVDVKLGITSVNIVARTTTDSLGGYYFNNLPFGTYTVFVDIPGLLKDSAYTVTIDSSALTWPYLDYIVDSTMIYITGNIGIEPEADANPNTMDVYPNPVKSNAMIRYTLAKESDVRIELFNMYGGKVGSLLNTNLPAGEHLLSFNPQTMGLKSGIYFITSTVNGRSSTRRIIVLE
jgi:PKD repeat protein